MLELEPSTFILMRHELHEIPEVKYKEFKTRDKIVEYLLQIGYKIDQIKEVEGTKGKTGIIVTLDFDLPGKTIALRADMDGLAVDEQTDNFPHSKHNGTMHACGHDGHCAVLLETAWLLKKYYDDINLKTTLRGCVKFIFQPAEENGHGALDLLNTGLLNTVDGIFGFHNWPGLETGKFQLRAGAMFTGNARFRIEIVKMDEEGCSFAASAYIIQLLERVRVQIQPYNIILNTTHCFIQPNTQRQLIKGTCFFENENTLNELKQYLLDTLKTLNPRFQVIIEFSIAHKPVINNKPETDLVHQAIRSYFGEAKVELIDAPAFAAEDFSDYLDFIPGCYYLIGNGEDSANLHLSNYQFNDEIIHTATQLFFEITKLYLTTYEPSKDNSQNNKSEVDLISILSNLSDEVTEPRFQKNGNSISNAQWTMLATININGIVAHTSQPQNAINPVLIGSQFILALTDYDSEFDYKIVNFEVGEEDNVSMSDKGYLIIHLRPKNKVEQKKIQKNIQDLIGSFAKTYGTQISLDIQPSLTNSAMWSESAKMKPLSLQSPKTLNTYNVV